MFHLLKISLPAGLLAVLVIAGCNQNSEPIEMPAESEEAVFVPPPAADAASIAAEVASQPVDETAQQAPPRPNPFQQMAENLKPEDIKKAVDENYGKFEELADSITDKQSAEEALPVLNQVRSALSMVRTITPFIPAKTRPPLIQNIQEMRAPIEEATAKLYENEEVKQVIESTIDGIKIRIRDIVAILEKPAPDEEVEAAAGDEEGETSDAESTDDSAEAPDSDSSDESSDSAAEKVEEDSAE